MATVKTRIDGTVKVKQEDGTYTDEPNVVKLAWYEVYPEINEEVADRWTSGPMVFGLVIATLAVMFVFGKWLGL